MKHVILSGVALLLPQLHAASFEEPQLLKTAEGTLSVESPGYACPSLADIDGDGKKDLVVGQFRGGKIQVFKGQEGGKYAAGAWLRAGGKEASVPGVW
ncbi:hypothetical protein [Rubritalea squalenifaciens]|nr:hypothetical protein [Rubritalea squalenifaciens]